MSQTSTINKADSDSEALLRGAELLQARIGLAAPTYVLDHQHQPSTAQA